MKLLATFLLFLLMCVGLNAEVVTTKNTKDARGEGYGSSYEEAVNKALADAISKMYGGKLAVGSKLSTDYTKTNDKQQLQKSYNEEIARISGGTFDSYEVISNSKQGDEYKVVVLIKKTTTTKKYKAPGQSASNRRSITVFNATPDVDKRGIGNNLQQQIITDLLQSRKFNVLERDTPGYYEMEKSLIKSGDAASDEIYKLKNVLATDYILLFSVSDIDGGAKKSNLTGKTKVEVEMKVDYRVLLFATRQIKFSNTLVMKTTIKDDSITADTALIEQIAGRISSDILNAIYPLKVASVENGEVVYTQKKNQGDTYECFALGKAIKDSYTKETTGRVETKSGDIEVVRSTPKLSYAKITSGSVKVGDICRPLSNGSGSGNGYTIGRDANYKIDENGGVNLGF